jgi:class 3 adenylate cyclase
VGLAAQESTFSKDIGRTGTEDDLLVGNRACPPKYAPFLTSKSGVDIVGYSKLLSSEQREVFALLNDVVRNTQQFRAADAAGKLVRIPTGDGMTLIFFTSVDAPVHCAREISRRLCEHPKLSLRMGINRGPIDHAFDVNERQNVTGAGINLAQRVMDCADAGHILLSRRVADDLAQYIEWQPYLHELGDVEVKHGVRLNS